MPAYMKPLKIQCARGAACGRKASYQVFNTQNSSQGFFCAPHAKVLVKQLNAWKVEPQVRRGVRA